MGNQALATALGHDAIVAPISPIACVQTELFTPKVKLHASCLEPTDACVKAPRGPGACHIGDIPYTKIGVHLDLNATNTSSVTTNMHPAGAKIVRDIERTRTLENYRHNHNRKRGEF